MSIPRIIHQTWKDHNVPEEFDRMARSWQKNHPGWKYMFWTDAMNRNFISRYFSFFLPVYDGYTANIQRVDAVRYFILYKYGGFFIDMDFECLASIEPVLGEADCVFGKEPAAHCAIHAKDIIISNAFMGAVPGAPFIGQLCQELQQQDETIDHPNNRVLETTGPFMLSRLYKAYSQKEQVCLLEPDRMYPLTKEELEGWGQEGPDTALQQKLKNAYGIHHYAGTWWKRN